MSQGGALMRPSEWLLVALSTIKSQTNTLTGKQQREGGARKPNKHSFPPNMVKMTFSPLKNITRHHFQVHFDHRQRYKKFEILTQNHRLTPLEKNPRWQPSQFDISIYGLDELVATQKHHQTSFPSLF